ncbi:hypothetical protein [Persephonella sp.]
MKKIIILSAIFLTLAGETFSQPDIKSDIRIEITSKIKVLKEEISKLEETLKISNDEESVKIKNKIKELQNKINNLKEILEKYENSNPTVS